MAWGDWETDRQQVVSLTNNSRCFLVDSPLLFSVMASQPVQVYIALVVSGLWLLLYYCQPSVFVVATISSDIIFGSFTRRWQAAAAAAGRTPIMTVCTSRHLGRWHGEIGRQIDNKWSRSQTTVDVFLLILYLICSCYVIWWAPRMHKHESKNKKKCTFSAAFFT